MISRTNRFHGYGSLRHVYRRGTTIRGPLFSIKVLENPKRSQYRLAVVVAKKVHKSAVARNRIRRRLYETVRLLGPDIINPCDIVITVFHDSLIDEPIASLTQQVKKQLQQAGVLARRVQKPKV